jgi:hypothetical protein
MFSHAVMVVSATVRTKPDASRPIGFMLGLLPEAENFRYVNPVKRSKGNATGQVIDFLAFHL